MVYILDVASIWKCDWGIPRCGTNACWCCATNSFCIINTAFVWLVVSRRQEVLMYEHSYCTTAFIWDVRHCIEDIYSMSWIRTNCMKETQEIFPPRVGHGNIFFAFFLYFIISNGIAPSSSIQCPTSQRVYIFYGSSMWKCDWGIPRWTTNACWCYAKNSFCIINTAFIWAARARHSVSICISRV